jgi:hypothetical protein
MQASDTFDRIRREIDARLHQLRPQVQEYATIEAAERLLGNSPSRAAVVSAKAVARRSQAEGCQPSCRLRGRAVMGRP